VASKSVESGSGFSTSDEQALTLNGFLSFADHALEGVARSIEQLRRDGVQVKILTGDNELVTRHVCRQVGLDAESMALGSDLERLDRNALGKLAERTTVFARLSPAQKHRVVAALKAAGHVVGYMGDGINDAPSLHEADVGISVAGAADVAREASDIILLEQHLDVLHAGILAGRRSFANVMKYLLMGTSSNFGNMFSMAAAALFLPFLPMLPTQILLNNLLYDLSQVTIPTDRVDAVYLSQPQKWDISLIRKFMLFIGPVSSLYDFLTFWALLGYFGFAQEKFHTGWFLESLVTQTLVLFVIRTAHRPWASRPSKALVATTLGIIGIALALPLTALGPWLGLVPLPPSYYVFLGLVVVSYLVLVEVIKRAVLGPVWGRSAKRVAINAAMRAASRPTP
jgi:Mg2+-importing ATPase